MPAISLVTWWLALIQTNNMTQTEKIYPHWWLVCLLSFLLGGLIVASAMIARLWIWVYGATTAEIEHTVTAATTIATTDAWSAETMDLSGLPEGNEYLNDATNVAESDTTIAAAGWTKFESRTLPISFNYPSTWKLWEGTTPLSDYIQIADYKSKIQDAEATTVPGHKLEIMELEQPLDLTLRKWMIQNDEESIGVVGTIEDLMIDGFPAKLDYQVIGYSTFGTVYIPLGDGTNQVILVSLFGPETTYEELRPLFQSILDSISISGM